MKKRIISMLTTAVLLFCTFSTAFAAGMDSMAAYDKVMNFRDVKESDWFFQDVIAMLTYGFMKGKSDTRFDPNGTLTNAETAQILYNAETRKTEGVDFLDVSGGKWYSMAVEECGEYFPLHWNRYQGGAMFFPASPITRAEFCYALLRAGGASDDDMIAVYESLHGSFSGGWRSYPEAAIQLMVDFGYVSGYGNGELGAYDNLTRAQCAAIINRMIAEN